MTSFGTGFLKSLLLAIALCALSFLTAFSAEQLKAEGSLEADTEWSGQIVIEKSVVVAEGARLTVTAGTTVSFLPGARLVVKGDLSVKGEANSPALFKLAQGADTEASTPTGTAFRWKGVDLYDSDTSVIEHARFSDYESINIHASSLEVDGCTFEGAVNGLKLMTGGISTVSGSTFTDIRDNSINVTTGAKVKVLDNEFTRGGKVTVANGQRGLMLVSGNSFTDCEVGVTVLSDGSEVSYNTFKVSKVAIISFQSGGQLEIKGNEITGGEKGIVCVQFSSPKVFDNRISGAQTGIYCFQGSNPTISNNLIAGANVALSCYRLCNPKVEANIFMQNETAIYLQTSSYAVISANNFESNSTLIELGDMMSADWEQRVRKKPVRSKQARLQELSKRGKAVMQKVDTEIDAVGEVIARGNWWGEATTAEMDKKGADAQIDGLKDLHDSPPLTYDGYEGEYKLDRIVYTDWLKAASPGAGPRPKSGSSTTP